MARQEYVHRGVPLVMYVYSKDNVNLIINKIFKDIERGLKGDIVSTLSICVDLYKCIRSADLTVMNQVVDPFIKRYLQHKRELASGSSDIDEVLLQYKSIKKSVSGRIHDIVQQSVGDANNKSHRDYELAYGFITKDRTLQLVNFVDMGTQETLFTRETTATKIALEKSFNIIFSKEEPYVFEIKESNSYGDIADTM